MELRLQSPFVCAQSIICSSCTVIFEFTLVISYSSPRLILTPPFSPSWPWWHALSTHPPSHRHSSAMQQLVHPGLCSADIFSFRSSPGRPLADPQLLARHKQRDKTDGDVADVLEPPARMSSAPASSLALTHHRRSAGRGTSRWTA
jgi:hypothetical protein